MSQTPRDILTTAVARNSAIVLSLPSAGMLRHHKSRFLNETDEGLWVEAVLSERPLIEALISASQPCGISFKNGDQKVSFATKAMKLEPEYRINGETLVPALLLERPADVKAVQRRSNYRARITEEAELRVQMWRIAEHVRLKDKPPRSAELAVELRDISIGGIGVTLLPKDDAPPKVLPGERVRVLLKHGESEEFLLEGRMRSPRDGAKPGTIQSGVQFKKLQDGLEGRQLLTELTKIVGALQMEEVRRHRMGI